MRKLRGSRYHGWGQIGQHRKHGAKGGRGMAGAHKHKWTWILKYYPEYFGKSGMVPPRRRISRAINLNQISLIAEQLLNSKDATFEDDKLVIDLTKLNYDKVLATGTLYRPVKIIAKSWSEKAEKKIKELGSLIIGPETSK
ncbi:MAG: uL15 family ribosomal protein [Nitrososphaerota archaeon]